LGLTVLLRGTGMVFHREVLESCPWQAGSVVEDVEHAVRLAQAGHVVRFVPEVRVWSAFPTSQRQMEVQRTRWIGGNARLAVRHAVPLVKQAIVERRPLLLDLAWTLFVSVRSLVVGQLLLAVLLGGLALAAAPGAAATTLARAGWIALGLQGAYFGLGVVRFGCSPRRLKFLLQTPLAVGWLLLIAAASILPGRTATWQRTPRG
jgi:hypothetical protein